MLCTRIVALFPKAVNRCRVASRQPDHPLMLIRIARLRRRSLRVGRFSAWAAEYLTAWSGECDRWGAHFP